MTAVTELPMGEPLLVTDVLVGGALSDGPAVLVVFTGTAWTAAVAWENAEDAERHLAAALADVRSRMPLPPVVDLAARR